jgi:hypothetical protein
LNFVLVFLAFDLSVFSLYRHLIPDMEICFVPPPLAANAGGFPEEAKDGEEEPVRVYSGCSQ